MSTSTSTTQQFPPPTDLEHEHRLIKSGTKSALDKLALHNMSEAIRYASQCSRGTMSQTELVSLCWIALRKAANNYRKRKSGGARFFAYSKVYIRAQINLDRKQNLDLVRNSESQAEEISETTESAVEPDFSNLESKELLAGLRPAIFSALNDRERAILILRYEAGFSFTEIGERIGFSRQSIQKSHCKALLKLRSALEQKRTQLL